MSTTDEGVRVGALVEPLTAVTRLASSGRFGEYVIYERPDGWVFAGGVLGAIELDTTELRVTWAGETRVKVWAGRPAKALERALAALPLAGRNAYGWVGFEACAYTFKAEDYLGSEPLAHLFVPQIEVFVDTRGAVVARGGSDEQDAVWEVLLAEANDSAGAAATADTADTIGAGGTVTPADVDVRSDTTGYRDRVAQAVGEIRDGRYGKVILSRKVDLPFRVDMPATYRLGREHNTPARSFLFRLGGLEAAGFSPELVVSVDDDRVVTTEPLAGTRAFGRGETDDLLARMDLESDPKEIVEHAVSVRASFAEIASIAEPGTPSVSDFMTVRERGSVQHLASTVHGTLSANRTSWDALEALFPSVTASGIPKRECVDAIFRLDGSPRGLYSGAVLTISPTGAMEATLVLRAAYQNDSGAWLRAGAGVIAQSVPEREFEETCEKLGSIAPYVVELR